MVPVLAQLGTDEIAERHSAIEQAAADGTSS